MIVPSVRVVDRDAVIRRLVEAVNGRLTLLDNISAAVITIADSGPADTQYVVSHNIGRIPSGYIWNIDKAGIVYDFNRSTWTSTQLKIKCSVANAALTLIVF